MAAEYSDEIFKIGFDAILCLSFVVDYDVRIQEYNAATAGFLDGNREIVLQRRSGEVLTYCTRKRCRKDANLRLFVKNVLSEIRSARLFRRKGEIPFGRIFRELAA